MQILRPSAKANIMPKWIMQDWLGRDALTLLVGAGGSSKSWAALDLGVACASVQTFLGQQVRPSRVLFVDEDGQIGETLRRVHRLAAGRGIDPIELLDESFFIAPSWGLRLDDPSHYHDLAVSARDLKVDLIIIDALCAIHSADENDNKAMAYIMRGLLRHLMRETSAGVLLLHHEGKPGEVARTGVHKVRGATEIINACDAAILCNTSGDSYTWTMLRSRYVPKIEWPQPLTYGMQDTHEATYLVHAEPPQSRLEACIDAIKALPEPRPPSIRTTEAALGGAFPFATVARALSRFRTETLKP